MLQRAEAWRGTWESEKSKRSGMWHVKISHTIHHRRSSSPFMKLLQLEDEINRLTKSSDPEKHDWLWAPSWRRHSVCILFTLERKHSFDWTVTKPREGSLQVSESHIKWSHVCIKVELILLQNDIKKQRGRRNDLKLSFLLCKCK